jgi:hypothetical protein
MYQILIKNTDSHQYVNSYSIKEKKMRHFFNIVTIFVLISTLVMSPPALSWNAYGQTNETNSQPEDVIQVIPETSSEENDLDTDEQLISENISSSEDSDPTGNQIVAEESNSSSGSTNSQPDGDCLFDPSLPKCAPDQNGNCPEGFGMNEDEQCFPLHDRCPEGYHGHEDDESGKCIPDDVPCQPGYIMNPDYPSCDREEYVCQNYPELEDCKVDDDTANNLPYRSGYNHGCSDAKISDSSKRYINQPGKGPSFHTSEFMRGYNDGFESCQADNNDPSTSGIFRVIVHVTNQSPQDISGGITISVDHQPQNIFRSAYGLYFPAGGTTSTIFTFKSNEVPVGTDFEVNVDYGDDYNQYKFGENSPVKRPELVSFVIP